MADKSAFPLITSDMQVAGEPGMTFREWQWTQFAAAAINGMFAADTSESCMTPDEKTLGALTIADRMMAAIAEREQERDDV